MACTRSLGKPGINFINILCSNFSYKSALNSFSLVTVWILWRKNIGAKAACKMLMKLTTGVNFTNLLCTAFIYPDPSAKKYSQAVILFGTFGIYEPKSCMLNVGEIDPWS